MKKDLFLLFLPIIAFALSSCDNDDEPTLMKWKIVSVTPDSDIQVAVNVEPDGNNNYFNANAIFVKASYKAGEVVLKCENYQVDCPTYTNEEMGFTIIPEDKHTVQLVFTEDASGKLAETEQITLTNSNGKGTLNTIIFIERSFGELQPTE